MPNYLPGTHSPWERYSVRGMVLVLISTLAIDGGAIELVENGSFEADVNSVGPHFTGWDDGLGVRNDIGFEAGSKKSCCSTDHTEGPGREEPPWTDDPQVQYIVILRALACQGQSLNWLAAVPTMVNPPLDLPQRLSPPAWLGPPESDEASCNARQPAVPPPESL